jgi:phosphoribosyl 1,2-cyclic phosphodiesterase/CheY-like chemotaxis protein
MARRLTVCVVDDSPVQAEIARALLEKAGHTVLAYRSSVDALREAPVRRPDCVLTDLMMPEVDGYELCRRLREIPQLAATKIVTMSTKAFPFERKRAHDPGANGYFLNPLNPAAFVNELERVVTDAVTVSFWGFRGTLPVSRRDCLRYGGNTTCVSLTFADGRLVIFDGGTGIKALSDALLAAKRTRIEGTILISHPHWDHINALPFFVPFYVQGNQFEICGPAHGDVGMAELISAQMDGVYFPVTVREFSANITYRNLAEGEFDVHGLRFRSMLLSHPGNCLGYRLDHAGRSFCFITDNEMYDPDSTYWCADYAERLAEFTRGADVLVTDCTYRDEDYPWKVTWGHSSVSQVVDLAARAPPKRLYLIHHDPDQNDDAIDQKVTRARELLAKANVPTEVVAPVELATEEL